MLWMVFRLKVKLVLSASASVAVSAIAALSRWSCLHRARLVDRQLASFKLLVIEHRDCFLGLILR